MLIDEPIAKGAFSKADALYNFCLSKIPYAGACLMP